MARLAAFHKYGKWQKKTDRRKHRPTAPLRETAPPTEKSGSHSLIVAASYTRYVYFKGVETDNVGVVNRVAGRQLTQGRL